MRQVGGRQCVVFAPDEPDGIGFDSGRHGFLQIPSHIERDLQVLVKGPVLSGRARYSYFLGLLTKDQMEP